MLDSIWEMVVYTSIKMGYVGIFLALGIEGLGLPFPGDVVLAFFGFLTNLDQFQFHYVVLAATLGSGLGSVCAFALGKVYGLPLLHKFGKYLLISQRSIELTTRFSRRYGVFVLLFGRMLPGIRTLSSYVAGIGNLSWGSFLLFSFAGFLLFCTFWLGVGYLLGEKWELVMGAIKEYLVGIAVAVILLGGVILLLQTLRKR